MRMKDLPTRMYHLMTYWQGEEIDPDVREKVMDGEISEEEEVKMFLEWVVKDYQKGTTDLSEEEKQFLTENGYSLTQSGNQTT